MPNFKDITLIVNANSRKSRDWQKQISDICAELGIEVAREHYIKSRKDFVKVIKKETKIAPDLMIVGGGDGTIQGVINEIDFEKTTICVLPLGTVNNFARSLKMDKDIKTSLSKIKSGKVKKVYLGEVNGYKFTNLAAIGISVKVAQNVSDKTKRVLGRLAYYLQGVYEIITHKPFLCEINVDDAETKIFYTHQMVVANGKFNGKVRFTPGANIHAGHLMAIIFGRDKRRWVHLKNILHFIVPSWIKGQPLAIRAEKITIHTTPSRAVEIDGEPVTNTPAVFKVIDKSLKVIVP